MVQANIAQLCVTTFRMVLSEFSDADGIRRRRRALSEAVGRAIQRGSVPIFAKNDGLS